jgi:hypothetical protein
MNKNIKNLDLLDNDSDEEIDDIIWSDTIYNNNEDDLDSVIDYESIMYDEESEDEYECFSCSEEIDDNDIEIIEDELDNPNIIINIIEDKENKNEKKVRITLEFNVGLNKKNEILYVDLDINQSTYLKIAEELFR